ncbi:MAG: tetratricopeptide repeat protein [Alphaproteobacteria bacterium]
MRRVALLALIFSVALATPSWATYVDPFGGAGLQISRSSRSDALRVPLLANLADRQDDLTQKELIDVLKNEALGGEPVASYRLSLIYYFGQGVPQDYEQAAKWSLSAAEGSVVEAQFVLSTLYADGRGRGRDYIEAYKWIAIVVARLPTGERRDIALGLRAIFEEYMSLDEVWEAERLAQEWMSGMR